MNLLQQTLFFYPRPSSKVRTKQAAMAANEHPSPFGPVKYEVAKMRNANLGAAISDVDRVIALLERTKEQVEHGTHTVPA